PTLISTLSLHDALPISNPLGFESALLRGDYGRALKALEQQFKPRSQNGSPLNFPVYEDLDLTKPLTDALHVAAKGDPRRGAELRSEEHTSELQSRGHLV